MKDNIKMDLEEVWMNEGYSELSKIRHGFGENVY
jgi:hypothetical protein